MGPTSIMQICDLECASFCKIISNLTLLLHGYVFARLCPFFTKNVFYQLLKHVLEIHWSETKIKRDLIDPELYVHTKKAPAKSAEEKWKWAAVGEILLCAKMLQRPILCVAPDLRRNLAATIYLPSDSSFHVSVSHSLLFINFIDFFTFLYRTSLHAQGSKLLMQITIPCLSTFLFQILLLLILLTTIILNQ